MKLVKLAILSLVAIAVINQWAWGSGTKLIYLIRINGSIDAGSSDLIKRGLRSASLDNASYVVIALDTYGGYLKSMDEIIDSILRSKVPIIVYVGPAGAKAESAGSYIAVAANYLIMHKLSTIGSASPVFLYPVSSTEREKVANYLVKRMETLAKARGRNVTACKLMIIKNLNYDASEALRLGIANYVVNNLTEGLTKLGLRDAKIVELKADWRAKLLSLLSDPTVIWLTFEAGMFMIIVDIFHTTALLTGLGVLLTALALFGIGVIGVDLLAVIALVIGSAFIAIELIKPGIQHLYIPGLASFLLGLLLAYQGEPYVRLGSFQVSLIALALFGMGLGGFYMYKIRGVLKRRSTFHDVSKLVGKRGIAKTDMKPYEPGVVLVDAETWTALSEDEVKEGEEVEIIRVDGMKLIVRRVRSK